MKVYLDDLRDTPEGWTRAYSVEDVVNLLKTRQVEALSLDNDLGDGFREGYKCLDYLEELVYDDVTFPIPEITIHSANASRVQYMNLAHQNLLKIRERQLSEVKVKMSILERGNNFYVAINKWMYANKWKTSAIAALNVVFAIVVMRYSPIVAIIPSAIAMLTVSILLLLSTAYLIKSGYKPKFCDKCGHVLPDDQFNG